MFEVGVGIFGFKTKAKFSSEIIPSKLDLDDTQSIILKFNLFSIPIVKNSYTFPSLKEKYYVNRIFFSNLPKGSLVNFRYGNKAYSTFVNSPALFSKFYSSSISIDFLKIYGVPAEIEAEETIILEVTAPENFVNNLTKPYEFMAIIEYV